MTLPVHSMSRWWYGKDHPFMKLKARPAKRCALTLRYAAR